MSDSFYSDPKLYPYSNSINIQPAEGYARHRLGAGIWQTPKQTYLISSIPRMNQDVNGAFYLDFEYNAVSVGESSGQVTVSQVETGNAYGLIAANPGTTNRLLTRIETAGLTAPLVVWAETTDQGSGSTSFHYYVPALDPNCNIVMPSPDQVKDLTIQGLTEGAITDFTTVTWGGKTHLFWVDQGDGFVNSALFEESGTCNAIEKIVGDPRASIVSLDAAFVQGFDPREDVQDPVQRSMIFVVALLQSTDGGDPFFTGWVLDADTFEVLRENLPQPAGFDFSTFDQYSSIRCAWGTVPCLDSDDVVQNGLVLIYSEAAASDSEFIEQFNEHKLGNLSSEGYGASYLSVIDLGLGADMLNAKPWQRIDPPGKSFDSGGLWALLAPATWASQLFSFTLTASGSETDVSYSLGFVTSAAMVGDVETQTYSSVEVWDLVYFQTYFSFGLKIDTSSPLQFNTLVTDQFSAGDAYAAVSSWILLGIIAGIPPYYGDGDGLSLSYSLDFSTSEDSELSVTKSLTIGSSAGTIDGSFETSINNVCSTTQSIEISTGEEFHPEEWPANQGMAIYLVPSLDRNVFHLSNTVGEETGLTIFLIYPVKSQSLIYVPFDITDPNTPVPSKLVANSLIQAAVSQFPTTVDGLEARWPPSDEPDQWRSAPDIDPSLWKVSLVASPSLQVGPAEVSKTISIAQKDYQSSDGEAVVTFGAATPAMATLFDFTATFQSTLSYSAKVSFGSKTAQSLTVSYPAEPDQSYVVGISVYLANDIDAPWVPKANSRQRPWLVSWSVQDA